MRQFPAVKENALTVFRGNVLLAAGMVQAQFAAVALLPAFVQVHNHGVLPATVVIKLVNMLFVKGTRFVQGIMKFVPRYTCIAGAV